MKKSNNSEVVQKLINWLQAANFILNFVKKPRHNLGYAYVFCLVQNKIFSFSLNHEFLNNFDIFTYRLLRKDF